MKEIPKQYLPIMPYLILHEASAFYDFAKKVFGATEQYLVRRPEDNRVIMHAEIRIGEAVIMFAHSTEEWVQQQAGMFLFVDDVDKVYKLALEEGSESLIAPTKQDYGYTAGFRDPFGNQWWITQP